MCQYQIQVDIVEAEQTIQENTRIEGDLWVKRVGNVVVLGAQEQREVSKVISGVVSGEKPDTYVELVSLCQ